MIFALALLVVMTGYDPVKLTEYSVIFSVVALPLTYLPILLVANDRSYMGSNVNGRLANVLGVALLRRHPRDRGRRDPADAVDERRPGVSEAVEVDIALGILDHQLVDSEGINCGKVDDLEIAGLDGGSPEVTEIIVGGNAWRSRGLLGRLAARLAGNAVHVPWSEVESVSSVVKLKRPAAELRLGRGDARWARLVGKAPGA